MPKPKKKPKKPKKPKREKRPFSGSWDPNSPDPPPPYPTCGEGPEEQIDVHGFALFDVPQRDSGLYFNELAKLTKKLNSAFRSEARKYVLKEQKKAGDKSIEVTIALVKGGLYLTYARPVTKSGRPLGRQRNAQR